MYTVVREQRDLLAGVGPAPVARASRSPLQTLVSGRVAARAIAQASGCHNPVEMARAFVHRVIESWWCALATPGLAVPGLRILPESVQIGVLPPSVEALAMVLGEAAAELDPELAAYQVGLTYTGMLPRTYRAALGVYYTPPVLTARLLEQVDQSGLDWTTCRVLDPACGGGAFLAPVARRILSAISDCDPRIKFENIANRLRGFEIDPFAAWMSRVMLDMVLIPVVRAVGRELPDVVEVRDSLRAPAAFGDFDLVIGNPPYGRVRLNPDDRGRFSRSLFGHANQYGLFTDLALQHARAGGVVAYVTPTSFLAGEYFKNLRTLLRRTAAPVTIDFVAVRKGVFADVLQETLLATFKIGRSSNSVNVHCVSPTSDTQAHIESAGEIPLPSEPAAPWILPRTAEQASLASVLARFEHRLSDWGYSVSTGPLVWNRHKDQLAEVPDDRCYPLIWAEAVRPDGTFRWQADRRNHTPWFRVLDGDEWLIVDRPCVLVQRTTAKEQARRLIAAPLPQEFLVRHDAAVVENHLNMVRPRVRRPVVSVEVLTAFLNSAAADRAFRCVSGSVAVSAYELEALPLPAPGALTSLSRLVRSGSNRCRIDETCEKLYAPPSGSGQFGN